MAFHLLWDDHEFCYFDPLNVQDMANKMLDTLNDPVTLTELRQMGLKVARSFNWNSTVEKTCDVIRKML